MIEIKRENRRKEIVRMEIVGKAKKKFGWYFETPNELFSCEQVIYS